MIIRTSKEQRAKEREDVESGKSGKKRVGLREAHRGRGGHEEVRRSAAHSSYEDYENAHRRESHQFAKQ